MNFSKFYYINEGGHAIKEIPVSGIKQINVKDTVEDIHKKFLSKLGLKRNNWDIIGSGGKKLPQILSGDLDIAIEYPKLLNYKNIKTMPELYEYIYKEAKKVSPEVNYIKGANIISMAWPIQGDQKGNYVQVDLMLTDNLKFTSWAYYGPGYWESKYKGVYRNLLLFAIMKNATIKIRKTKTINGEEIPVEIEKFVLNLSKGLTKIIQSKESIKNPDKVLKNFKTIERKFLSKDPDEIVHIILGYKYNANDIKTFENLWRIINSPNFNLDKNKVIDLFKKYLEDNKLPYPEELK